MEDNRWEEVEQILREEGILKGKSDEMGVGTNTRSLYMKNNPDVIRKIESLGFKVIYPAEISEDDKKRVEGDIADKNTYEKSSQRALIVDTRLKYHSAELADQIKNQYFSLAKSYASDYRASLDGVGQNENIDMMEGGFKAKRINEYEEILKSVGFDTEQVKYDWGNAIKVHVDRQLPVKQSKFSQIYMSAKDKIQGLFNKVKALAKSKNKEQEKENDSNER